MIVRARDERLELYEQIEHARIASEFARQFGGEGFVAAEPREKISNTILIHDCGWREFDKAPVVNNGTGRPRSFMETPAAESAEIWSLSIQGAAKREGPFGGLVVSAHFSRMASGSLESNDRSEDEREAFARFVATQRQWQSKWRAELAKGSDSPSGESVDEAAALLQACDMFSIYMLIGSGDDPIDGDPCALGAGGENVTFRFAWPALRSMTINPWPFRREKIEIKSIYRAIPDREYGSCDDLRKTLAQSVKEDVRYCIVPGERND